MSLMQKIWLLIAGPFVIGMLGYVLATRPLRHDLLIREASREVVDDVLIIESALSQGVVDPDNADLVALTNAVSRSERVLGVAVYAANGVQLARSDQFPANADADDLAHKALAAKGAVSDVRDEGRVPMLEHAVPLGIAGSATGGVIVVYRDIGYVDPLLAEWSLRYIIAGILAGGVLLLLSRPVVQRVVGKPLAEVVGGVERVAAGDLEAEVRSDRKDELGRLARAFNAMTRSLRSARARVEEEHAHREALEGKLRHLQTLAAAGEVAASMAHEIGSPLNVILGRTRMIASRASTDDAARQELEVIAAQTERITRVVERFLRVSRLAASRREEVDIGGVVNDTLALLGGECRKRGISITTTISEDPRPIVLGDRDELMQMLFNLAMNAIQAQPNGGLLEVGVSRKDQSVFIEVRDRGPGLAPEVRGRLFDPFVTTKGDRGGTGLGLAIVDGMVREMGGRVDADDAEGGGACFRVQIPAPAPRLAPAIAGTA